MFSHLQQTRHGQKSTSPLPVPPAFTVKPEPAATAERPALPGRAQLIDPDWTRRTAHRGVRGPGKPLPYQRQIQRAFGHYDISGIRAHTQPGAVQAARAIGARAYATGSSIAFSESRPSLHTVAHEAAHVVQQRHGVRLKGGVGRAGDHYEHQADRVADKVVAGQSAVPVLSTNAGSPGRPGAEGARAGGDVQMLWDANRVRQQAGEPKGKTWYGRQLSKTYRLILAMYDQWHTDIRNKPPFEKLFFLADLIRAIEVFIHKKNRKRSTELRATRVAGLVAALGDAINEWEQVKTEVERPDPHSSGGAYRFNQLLQWVAHTWKNTGTVT